MSRGRHAKPEDWQVKPAEFDAIIAAVATGRAVRKCIAEQKRTQYAFYAYLNSDQLAADRYARAKAAGLEAMADDMLEIADDMAEIDSSEAVQRARLRVDTRKWLLSKLAPKKYGDKVDLNHSGEVRVTRRMFTDAAPPADAGGS